MSENRLVATCLLGLEGLVADELRRMDIKNVEPQNGRVLFSGNQSETAGHGPFDGEGTGHPAGPHAGGAPAHDGRRERAPPMGSKSRSGGL